MAHGNFYSNLNNKNGCFASIEKLREENWLYLLQQGKKKHTYENQTKQKSSIIVQIMLCCTSYCRGTAVCQHTSTIHLSGNYFLSFNFK